MLLTREEVSLCSPLILFEMKSWSSTLYYFTMNYWSGHDSHNASVLGPPTVVGYQWIFRKLTKKPRVNAPRPRRIFVPPPPPPPKQNRQACPISTKCSWTLTSVLSITGFRNRETSINVNACSRHRNANNFILFCQLFIHRKNRNLQNDLVEVTNQNPYFVLEHWVSPYSDRLLSIFGLVTA